MINWLKDKNDAFFCAHMTEYLKIGGNDNNEYDIWHKSDKESNINDENKIVTQMELVWMIIFLCSLIVIKLVFMLYVCYLLLKEQLKTYLAGIAFSFGLIFTCFDFLINSWE